MPKAPGPYFIGQVTARRCLSYNAFTECVRDKVLCEWSPRMNIVRDGALSPEAGNFSQDLVLGI